MPSNSKLQNGRRKQNFNKFKQLLINPVTSASMAPAHLRAIVSTCLELSPGRREVEEIVSKLLHQQNFRSQLNACQSTRDGMPQLPVFLMDGSLEKLITFVTTVLVHEASRINLFFADRDGFEDAIVKSRYDRAESILAAVENSHGISLWLIRSKILLLAYQGRSVDLEAYCIQEMARAGDEFQKSLINSFRLFSDSAQDSCLELYNSLVHRHVVEFQEAKLHGMASFLSLLFAPPPVAGKINPAPCIQQIQRFSLIDQYITLLNILQSLVVDEISGRTSSEIDIRYHLAKLAKAIRDPQLIRTHKLLTSSLDVGISKEGQLIIEHYEGGRYQEAIDAFQLELPNLTNPISYVNLIAKAGAYTGNIPKLLGGGIIQDLVEKLAPVYGLLVDHHTAEDELQSRVIRLRGLTQSANVQMALCLAMPFLFTSEEIKRASAFAGIVNGETTPMVANILGGAVELFGAKYNPSTDASLPDYRELKRLICHAVNVKAEENEIEKYFCELKASSPLLKDYLELHSEYCIFKSNVPRLLEIAADALVRDPNTYACLPMAYLVERIESEFICTLEAILVAYCYATNISQSINGLLSEIFEEFVVTQGADKPSELLLLVKELSPSEIVFFRDVCVPDIMDCLPCFRSINELRTERVQILNLLYEKDVVGSAMRTREVDELIGRSIVETATTTINSGKIFIDTNALIKSLEKEVVSLLASYKTIPPGDEDRMTVWKNSQSEENMAEVYLTGSKSAICLRLLSLHNKSFMFDEEYGLDKNLSTEIRHGFFANLMRSIVQKHNLITESSKGSYADNDYWRAQYVIINAKTWAEINDRMKSFSRGFNELISRTEEWMNIRVSPEQRDRMFVYETPYEFFIEAQTIVETAVDSREVSKHIFGWLLETTEVHLANIRDRLHSEFQKNLDMLFTKLIEDIRGAAKGAALVELMNEIRLAQSEAKEQIATISGWFRSATQLDLDNLSLDRAIEIAITTYQNINGAPREMLIQLAPQIREVPISGRSVKAFTIALINLLDNCYGRSGLGQNTKVEIRGERRQYGAIISVANTISGEVASRLDEVTVAEINKRLTTRETSLLLRTEGGTGLVKAANKIAEINNMSSLNVKVENCNFKAEISYVNSDPAC